MNIFHSILATIGSFFASVAMMLNPSVTIINNPPTSVAIVQTATTTIATTTVAVATSTTETKATIIQQSTTTAKPTKKPPVVSAPVKISTPVQQSIPVVSAPVVTPVPVVTQVSINPLAGEYTSFYSQVNTTLTSANNSVIPDTSRVVFLTNLQSTLQKEMQIFNGTLTISSTDYANYSSLLATHTSDLQTEETGYAATVNQAAQAQVQAQQQVVNNAAQAKQAQLDVINLQIANLNAKYAQDMKNCSSGGGTMSGVYACQNATTMDYTNNYNTLMAEFQQVKYSN